MCLLPLVLKLFAKTLNYLSLLGEVVQARASVFRLVDGGLPEMSYLALSSVCLLQSLVFSDK